MNERLAESARCLACHRVLTDRPYSVTTATDLVTHTPLCSKRCVDDYCANVLRCENCGKTMAAHGPHGPLASCWPDGGHAAHVGPFATGGNVDEPPPGPCGHPRDSNTVIVNDHGEHQLCAGCSEHFDGEARA